MIGLRRQPVAPPQPQADAHDAEHRQNRRQHRHKFVHPASFSRERQREQYVFEKSKLTAKKVGPLAPEEGLGDQMQLINKEMMTILPNRIKLFFHYFGKFFHHHFSIFSPSLLHVLLHTFSRQVKN